MENSKFEIRNSKYLAREAREVPEESHGRRMGLGPIFAERVGNDALQHDGKTALRQSGGADAMTPTLLEGAIAILLVWIAWQIGSLLAPRIMRRFKGRAGKKTPDQKNKPPYTIDI